MHSIMSLWIISNFICIFIIPTSFTLFHFVHTHNTDRLYLTHIQKQFQHFFLPCSTIVNELIDCVSNHLHLDEWLNEKTYFGTPSPSSTIHTQNHLKFYPSPFFQSCHSFADLLLWINRILTVFAAVAWFMLIYYNQLKKAHTHTQTDRHRV